MSDYEVRYFNRNFPAIQASPNFVPAADPHTSLTYRTTQQTASDTSVTITNQAVGSAAATRRVIVGVVGASGGDTITGVTIQGITATAIVPQVTQSGDIAAAMYGASVPTGTTATIVVSFSGTWQNIATSVWTVNMATLTPVDTASNTQASAAAMSFTGLNVPALGFALVVAKQDSGNTYTINQSFTERFDTSGNAAADRDNQTQLTGATVTLTWAVSGDPSAGVMASWQ